MHTGIPYKDVSFGMQTFDFGLVRNSDFGMKKLGQLLDGLALGGTAICCGNDTQAGPFAVTEFFQIFKKETKTGHFQERDDKVNFIRTGYFPPDFFSQ